MKRTLIYAMQSSGASYYTFCRGQEASKNGRVLCIPDLWHPFLAPAFEDVACDEIILKVVVTNRYTLSQHASVFKPDRIILFCRRHEDNLRSLNQKSYRDESGTAEFKFELFKLQMNSQIGYANTHDDRVWYEAIEKRPVSQSDLNTMLLNNNLYGDWAGDYYQTRWGFGGIHTTQ